MIGLCLVVFGLCGNYLLGYANDTDVTDYEIAMMHASKVYGGDDFEVVILNETDDEYIHYEYRKGYVRINEKIYRDANYDILTGYYDDVQD
jgi:hypothetical protein